LIGRLTSGLVGIEAKGPRRAAVQSSGLEIDHRFEPGQLLDGQILGFVPFIIWNEVIATCRYALCYIQNNFLLIWVDRKVHLQ
jgi:hypothetical protein